MTWVTLLKAIVLSCSISLAAAQSDIRSRAEARRDDPTIEEALDRHRTASSNDRKVIETNLEGLVRRYDAIRKPIIGENPAARARSIKQNPLYTDPAEGKESNWLGNSMEKFQNWINKRIKPPKATNAKPPNMSWLGPLLTYTAWTILGLAIVGAIYLLVKHVQWKGTLRRRATAMLHDDEPERSLDEWLALADEHEQAGRYREAVRCLYLACLLKFDEGAVARFDRGQTNWEHLARIEASPRMPDTLDFRSPTKLFDRIWYGHFVRGAEDVQEFRTTYLAVKDRLAGRKAA